MSGEEARRQDQADAASGKLWVQRTAKSDSLSQGTVADACAFLVEAFLSWSASRWGPQRGRGPWLTCLICLPVLQVPLVPAGTTGTTPGDEGLQTEGKIGRLQAGSRSSEARGPSAPGRRASRPHLCSCTARSPRKTPTHFSWAGPNPTRAFKAQLQSSFL